MAETVDAYILSFPPEIQERLLHMRALVKQAAPEAAEKMSWQMPTFAWHGIVVHFAAHAHHIGFYPGAEGVAAFADKLGKYKTSKGTIQLPYDRPIPDALVLEITAYRATQNKQMAEAKAAKPKKQKNPKEAV